MSTTIENSPGLKNKNGNNIFDVSNGDITEFSNNKVIIDRQIKSINNKLDALPIYVPETSTTNTTNIQSSITKYFDDLLKQKNVIDQEINSINSKTIKDIVVKLTKNYDDLKVLLKNTDNKLQNLNTNNNTSIEELKTEYKRIRTQMASIDDIIKFQSIKLIDINNSLNNKINLKLFIIRYNFRAAIVTFYEKLCDTSPINNKIENFKSANITNKGKIDLLKTLNDIIDKLIQHIKSCRKYIIETNLGNIKIPVLRPGKKTPDDTLQNQKNDNALNTTLDEINKKLIGYKKQIKDFKEEIRNKFITDVSSLAEKINNAYSDLKKCIDQYKVSTTFTNNNSKKIKNHDVQIFVAVTNKMKEAINTLSSTMENNKNTIPKGSNNTYLEALDTLLANVDTALANNGTNSDSLAGSISSYTINNNPLSTQQNKNDNTPKNTPKITPQNNNELSVMTTDPTNYETKGGNTNLGVNNIYGKIDNSKSFSSNIPNIPKNENNNNAKRVSAAQTAPNADPFIKGKIIKWASKAGPILTGTSTGKVKKGFNGKNRIILNTEQPNGSITQTDFKPSSHILKNGVYQMIISPK